MQAISGRYLITLLVLALTLAASRLSENRRPEPLAQPLDSIDAQIGDWTVSRASPASDDTLQVLRPTSYLSRTYRRGDRNLDLFIAFYAQQRAGESMHSPKNCLPGSGWEVRESGKVGIEVRGRDVVVNRYLVRNGSDQMQVLYWYQSKGRIVASEYYAKICLVRDAVVNAHTAGSLVRVVVPDRPGSLDEATSFAALLIPQMERCLGP